MIPELGLFALILALVVAAVQGSAILPRFAAVAQTATLLQFALVMIAFIALTYAYIVTDLSVLNVVDNSHSLKPLLYQIAGVWGDHEGSLLLWILVLATFGLFVALKDPAGEFTSKVLGVQGLISVGFILFALFSSNPFTRVDLPPIDGKGLNPVLQDPALAMHPPMLYTGYVGFSVVFSYAAAALLTGRMDATIASRMRLWIMLAWTGLSAGIALGSWWAYYELGWGGWWFWDPVENASLMPWLAGTALLHSVIVTEHRDALKRWTLLLSIITFSLSLLGTFLVRSGVLTSVHTFASDPLRGLFILLLLTLYTGGALMLYGFRAGRLDSQPLFSPVSREGVLVLNNLFLATACATVLIGTLYPLILNALNLGQISVGPPYFNATFVPLSIPLIILMGIGPMMAWKQADLGAVLHRLTFAALFAGFVMLVVFGMQTRAPFIATIGLGLAGWIVAATLMALAERIALFRAPLETTWERLRALPLKHWSMMFAHAGLGIAIAGMIGSSLWTDGDAKVLKNGEGFKVGSYSLTLQNVTPVFGTNYASARGSIEVSHGRHFFTMTPERRHYPVAQQTTSQVAIRQSWHDDLYVVLGDRDDKGGWVVRAWTHPLVPLLWMGYAMIALGGLMGVGSKLCRKI